MAGFLNQLVTPAIVSLAVSLWAGRVMEARRARRDHLTKLFEQAREDVRRSVEAAIDYFATEPSSRSALQEAKIVGADRELRSAIPMILDEVDAQHCEAVLSSARASFETLIIELTGGNFQMSDGDVSHEHLRRLAHAGAKMRTAIARLRDRQLSASADQDILVVSTRECLCWLKENNPFRKYPS